jgi:O-antigen ligase
LWTYLLFAALAAETLCLSGSVPNAFTVPKVVAALLGGALLAPLLAASRRRTIALFSVQLLVLAASTAFSKNLQLSLWGGDSRRMGLLTWTAILVAGAAVPVAIDRCKDRWTVFLRIITAIGAIAGAYGILQWFNLDPILSSSVRDQLTQEFGGAYRSIGTIGQPTFFATYLLYPFFGALALLRFDRSKRWRRFGVVALLIVFVALISTMSRGPILGAVCGVTLLLYSTMHRRRTVVVVVCIIVSVAACGLLMTRFSAGGKQLKARLEYIRKDTTGGGRLVLWQDVATRLLPEVWLKGTGLGMFRPAFAQVRSDRYSAFNPDVHWENAHNIFLDRWTEQGVAGLGMVIFIIAATIANYRAALKHVTDEREKWAIQAVIAAFISACVANLFNGESIPTAYYFFVWAGFSFATRECFAREDTGVGEGNVSTRQWAFALTLALACVFVWHARNNWEAESSLARAARAGAAHNEFELLVSAKASEEAFPEKGTYALEAANLIRQFVADPALGEPAKQRLVREAIEYGLLATETDKSMLAFYGMAEMGSAIQDDRTETWLRQLIFIDPFWYRPHRLLGSWLLRRQRFVEAEAEANTAMRLAPYDNGSQTLSLQIAEIRSNSGGIAVHNQEEAKKWAAAMAQLPLTFEPNQGQADGHADFVARGEGYTVLTSHDGAVLALGKIPKASVVRMKFLGTNDNTPPAGIDQQPGRVSYFVGQDASKWRTNIPTFERVNYPSVYDGIDIVYYGRNGRLEYDFAVSPGADPKQIAMSFGGDVQSVDSDSAGNLNLHTPSGTVQLHRPRTYQQLPSGEREVPSCYRIEKDAIRVEVGPYDRARPLIIDPVIVYSTYLGGTLGDFARSITLDASGNAVIAGGGYLFDYPPASVFGNSVVNPALIAQINPSGTALLYTAYISGSDSSEARAVAVDASGNAYITGDTVAPDFPVTSNAAQSHKAGSWDAFAVTIYMPFGQLLYSTYIGGSLDEDGNSIAVDASGGLVIAGITYSTDFPTANAVQPRAGNNNSNGTGFVTKINPDGSVLYSTYLGGTASSEADGVAMDPAGNAFVIGSTTSADLAVVNPIQPTLHGQEDAFITKLSFDGSSVLYSTYLGGSSYEFGRGIAIDSLGNAYVTGMTYSPDFPTVNAAQPTFGPGAGINAFITKISADGTSLIYSTYFGAVNEQPYAIAIDASGNAYVVGLTNSTNLPLVNPVQGVFKGKFDIFIVKLSAAGSTVLFSTYLGGSDVDYGSGIAADASGNAYIAGWTFSGDFPTVAPLQPPMARPYSGVVAKIDTVTIKRRTGQITSQ